MKELFSFNKDIRQFEKVVIYGSGMAGRGLLYKLLQYDVKVECFADADPLRCGVKFLNIPVVHIDALPAGYKEEAAVIVSGRFAFEVGPKLEKRGFAHVFLDYGNEVGAVHLERDG